MEVVYVSVAILYATTSVGWSRTEDTFSSSPASKPDPIPGKRAPYCLACSSLKGMGLRGLFKLRIGMFAEQLPAAL